MKRALIATALMAASGFANAGLSFVPSATENRTETFNIAGFPTFAVGSAVPVGQLITSETGNVTFTYLGQESGYSNSLHLANGLNLFESNAVGTSISLLATMPGIVPFSFREITSPALASASNGGPWSPNTSIGLIGQNMSVLGNSYSFVLGYNDSAGSASLGDWDDFAIGVNFASPAPEPEVYGMLAAGLGLLGWVGRRRKQ